MPLHLAFSQMAHAIHEVVPLRDGDTELILHYVRIEASVVRHLDGSTCTVQGDGQGVITDHAHRSRRCSGGQGAVTRRSQQQVAVDLVVTLDRRALPGARQCPELATTLEHASGFQLISRDLGEIPVKLQNLPRLHGVITLGDNRQRCLGIRAIEHLLFRVGMNCA